MGGRIFKVFVSLLCILALAHSQQVFAEVASPSTVIINELQVNGIGTGTTAQEFIELKNISDTAIDIGGWKLQYISSTGNLATAKYFVTFTSPMLINPGGFLLVTPDTYLAAVTPKITYTITSSFAGLAASGGTVQLVDAIGVVVDTVGWGTKATTICETELATAPTDGGSIQRRVIEGKTQDTNNNKTDFEALAEPTPQTENAVIEQLPPDPTPSPDPTPDPTLDPAPETTPIIPDSPEPTSPSDQTPQDTTTTDTVPEAQPTETSQQTATELPILLNELYIDPISPQTDTNDEWVELYNPNNTPQDLAGYTIYAGDTFAYHHTFGVGSSITAHGYLSVSSGDTSLALANGGGKVKLVGPTGVIYDETSYATAKAGESWAKNNNGIWEWTITPTQNAQNTITVPTMATAVVAKAATSAKKNTSKKASTTKATSQKSSPAKITKVKAATTSANNEETLVSAPTPLPLWLLATLGVLAVLYSGYEYRFDIANKLYQLRSYRAARAANRRQP